MLMEQLNYNLLFRWFVALNMDDPLGRDLLPHALHRARIEPDHSNVILNGGILCLGRRTVSLAPSTENVSPGRGNIAACGCPHRDWSRRLNNKQPVRCRLGPLRLV
jgi:hypothetical protein